MKNIWLIGAGDIAVEYAKVLENLQVNYEVIGRSQNKADHFSSVMNKSVITGGLIDFLATNPVLPDAVIVAVNLTELKNVAISLMKYGVRQILLEKPGFCEPIELNELCQTAKETSSEILLAYNRRFYSSVLQAEKIMQEDGGIKSFNFEFTEWSHAIEKMHYTDVVFRNWFYANSSHVVDLAFFLGGEPKQLSSFVAGQLSWHNPSIFVGAGITSKNALFSYQANWNAPGRWSVELLTEKHRLYLKPMESLQIQEIDSVAVNPVEIDNRLDIEYKPGFFLQTKAFIEGDYGRLCSIEEQQKHIENIYGKMCR